MHAPIGESGKKPDCFVIGKEHASNGKFSLFNFQQAGQETDVESTYNHSSGPTEDQMKQAYHGYPEWRANSYDE